MRERGQASERGEGTICKATCGCCLFTSLAGERGIIVEQCIIKLNPLVTTRHRKDDSPEYCSSCTVDVLVLPGVAILAAIERWCMPALEPDGNAGAMVSHPPPL